MLKACEQVINERGYASATIKRICAASGASPSSIYWMFSSKDELILAVLAEAWMNWASSLEGSMRAHRSRTRNGRFAVLLAHELEYATTNPTSLAIGYAVALTRETGDETIWREFRRQMRATEHRLLAALQDAHEADLSDRPGLLLIRMLLAVRDGLYLSRQIDSPPWSLGGFARLLDTVAAGHLGST